MTTAEMNQNPVALAVKVQRAMQMLDCGRTRLYELIDGGQLESFLDGAARKITVASINKYVADRIAASKNKKLLKGKNLKSEGKPAAA
jgi:hypothetical protein